MEIKELQEQLGAAQLQISALKDGIEERDARIETLEAELTTANPSIMEEKTPTIPTETFEVNGKEYRFLVPSFYLKGERYVAADVLDNAEWLAELVENKIGIIEAVTDEN